MPMKNRDLMVPRTRIELVRSGEGPQDFKSEGKVSDFYHYPIISRYLHRFGSRSISPNSAINRHNAVSLWEKDGAEKTNILLNFGAA